MQIRARGWGHWRAALTLGAMLGAAGSAARGQGAACPAPPTPTAADQDYAEGNYAEAEAEFHAQLREHPDDARVIAGLVKTLVREGKSTVAAAAVQAGLQAQPHSAALLTALAETELREGKPWAAQEAVTAAIAADACSARAELVRARVLRMSSEYLSEREALQRAYDLDPKDREIARAYKTIVVPAADAASSIDYLTTTKNVEPEVRKAAEASIAGILPALSETSQTCQVLPKEPSATLPLLPSMRDGKELDGYKLEVELPRTRARLLVDTAASGLFVSRPVADANGMQHREGDAPGTVRAEMLRVGPLEFHDCLVGVSETPFPEKAEGVISTDLFDHYLVTLKMREAKLELTPLPGETSEVPGNRSVALEKDGYFPVYRRAQYMMVPVTLDSKQKRLFPVDTGMRYSTLSEPVVLEVVGQQKHLTNTLPTASGAKLQVYRDTFDYGFPDFVLRQQGNIFDVDSTVMQTRAGVEIGGLLGFEQLRGMTVHLDYRDGLVKLEAPAAEATPGGRLPVTELAQQATGPGPRPECAHEETRTGGVLVQVQTMGMWDAAHMKVGEQVVAMTLQEYDLPQCVLEQGSPVYGRVLAATAKGASPSLAVLFDRAECRGKGRQPMHLELIGLVAPPTEYKGIQSALPTSIGGGLTRDLSSVVSAQANGTPQNLAGQSQPTTLIPGTIFGRPDLKLGVEEGPSCSGLLTDSTALLRIAAQSRLYLLETP